MPSTLYAAQVPAGYNTASTGKVNTWNDRATEGAYTQRSSKWLPYIVSGPLSDGMWIVGTIGAIVHVLMWVFSLVMDGLLVSRGDSAGGWGSDTGLQFAIFSLIFTLLGFVTLLVICVTHWATSGIKDGAIPPFLITLLTGSVKITIGIALVLLIGIGGAVYHTPTGDDLMHYSHEQRWIVILNFVSKTYVATALAANIQYSGSYADRK
mgnify:FL=1